ncbi:hypothetical protein OCUBac02_51300 (plasmid) [Bosea sp. ANAM02]|nr:hypothetical protein OCUBac02_51300 [Bosea sp. ANAM02]
MGWEARERERQIAAPTLADWRVPYRSGGKHIERERRIRSRPLGEPLQLDAPRGDERDLSRRMREDFKLSRRRGTRRRGDGRVPYVTRV